MPRYLVCHDYGMGALWWWIVADSPLHIVETFAEVQVIDPERIEADFGSDLAEYHVDDVSADPALPGMRAERDRQRTSPDFGALVGPDRVYLHRPGHVETEWDYFQELDSEGYRVRQVEVRSDEVRLRTGVDDWLFDPPTDLYDPELARLRIDAADFEAEWDRARPPCDDERG